MGHAAEHAEESKTAPTPLFDRTVAWLDKWIAQPSPLDDPKEEEAHLKLLEEANNRAQSTMRAIQEGNLVAAYSKLENVRASEEYRYRQALQFARTQGVSVGAMGQQKPKLATTSDATKI